MWYEKVASKSNLNGTEFFPSAYGEMLADESIDEMDSFQNKYYEGSFMTILTASTKSANLAVPQSSHLQSQQ
jgi:hypothetical protein